MSNVVGGDNTVVDGRAGAVNVDLYANGGRKVWFTTRDGVNPRVFVLQPPANLKYGSAQWTSWSLNPAGLGPTGGLKRIRSSYDRRYVFVRTVLALQKIDTVANRSTSYCDDATSTNIAMGPGFYCNNFSAVSDVAVDNQNNVYSTSNGVLERVNAGADSCAVQPCAPASITQWPLNSPLQSAGNCQTPTAASPCISGVAVHPQYQNLVYVAEPADNTIAEVDTSCGNIRRWNVGSVLDSAGTPASQPRQINIDQDGIIWIVTGSGHLVSLDPKRSIMASYPIPASALNDTFGVAPDAGMIGYTATAPGPTLNAAPQHKVAMLVPKTNGTYVCWTPSQTTPGTVLIQPICATAIVDSGSTPGIARTVNTMITPEPSGTFVEAYINQNTDTTNPRTSMLPLGIAPDFDKAVGTFFYAVGEPDNPSVDRIGYARLPRKGFKAKHEREDKDCNDDGSGQDDEDHDGVPDRYKTNDSHAKMDRHNDSLAPGQTTEYNLSTGSSTMAIVAAIQSDNILEPVSVQVIDPNGITLALPVATPGMAVATVIPTTAGTYTVRVKNEGALPINPETQLITREPLSIP
jgi:hypothetical protein